MSSTSWLPSLFTNSEQWVSRYTSGNWTCSPSSFATVDLPNIEVLTLTAEPRDNYTYVPPPPYDQSFEPTPGLNFCNLTVSYTHPGWNDTIVTSIFLPTQNWNGRYQAHGGGGMVTGGSGTLFAGIMTALAEGFAVSTTDGGHISDGIALGGSESPWTLTSPGNVNWPLLIDFASLALHEMAVLSKAAVQDFYEESPKYSYWFGGSQGGRQGQMFSQQYPKDFDGIVALFPAINWNQLAAQIAWPVFVMDKAGIYPPPCETNAITEAAIAACDPLDGVEDGLISRPGLCTFDAHSVVGKAIDCEGAPSNISEGAAIIAQATWDGPRSSTGEFYWYGYLRGSNISQPGTPAGTSCTVDNSTGVRTCEANAFLIGQVWYNYWVQKYADASIRNITHEEWDDLVYASTQEYESVLGTSNPDLSRFKRAGGKMITWHGLIDDLISPNGTVDHYDRVTALDPEVHDYYRFFLAPGIGHEFLGAINVPDTVKSIIEWVEHDVAPEVLRETGVDPKGNKVDRDICPYPKVQHYVGGNSTKAEAFECV
ncbi:Nn.00g044410.m01.CDS01 [Neocucurbitaria sp. VM-36]